VSTVEFFLSLDLAFGTWNGNKFPKQQHGKGDGMVVLLGAPSGSEKDLGLELIDVVIC
jgi:hypothetical protein